MTTIERYDPTDSVAVQPPTARRLVEWADEARAAFGLAESLCKTPFAGQFRGDPVAGAAAILRGSELGLSPVTALSAFDVIQGQVAPKAVALRAFAQSHGHQIDIVESTRERAVAQYRRAGRTEWLTCEFTIDDARGLGLLSRDQWKRQPRTMLEARVTSKAARLVAADVLLGIAYSAEELYDSPPATPAPSPRSVAQIARDRTQTPQPGYSSAPTEVDVVVSAGTEDQTGPGVGTPGDERAGVLLPTAPAPGGGGGHGAPPPPPAGERYGGRTGDLPPPPPEHEPITQKQRGLILASFDRLGFDRIGVTDRDARLALAAKAAGLASLASTNDLTKAEASRVIDALGQAETADDLQRLLDERQDQ